MRSSHIRRKWTRSPRHIFPSNISSSQQKNPHYGIFLSITVKKKAVKRHMKDLLGLFKTVVVIMDGKAGKRSGRKSQLVKGRFCRLFWVLIGDGVPQSCSTSCAWDLRRNRSKTSTRTSWLCDLLGGVIGVYIMVLGLMVSVRDVVVVVFRVTCNRFLLLWCWHRNTQIHTFVVFC